jgi:uncharacterized tellurite resistance protein B-like protein
MTMTREEAFVGALACAMAADGHYHDAEKRLLDVICEFHHFTRNLDDDAYTEIIQNVQQTLSNNGWNSAIRIYMDQVPNAWIMSLLYQIVDMLLIDGEFKPQESKFLDIILERFEFNRSDIEHVVEIMREKNGILAPTTPALSIVR